MISLGRWFWYFTDEKSKLEKHKCGKWMYFFEDQVLAQQVCEKAIAEKVCYECKCTDLAAQMVPQGVVCHQH